MIRDSSSFIKLEKTRRRKCSFGGNSKGKIIEHGTVMIGSLIINNVSLVKGLNYNLLSISQLCDIGFRINFQEDVCFGVSRDFSQTFTGRRHDNIYLQDINPESYRYLISIQDEANL